MFGVGVRRSFRGLGGLGGFVLSKVDFSGIFVFWCFFGVVVGFGLI